MRARDRSGFTIIELLCSLGIILILVGMMLGPVMKAYKRAQRLGREEDPAVLADRFRQAMARHFGASTNYQERTVNQLYADGLIDGDLRAFLRRKEVRYLPFSSATPDTAPILLMEIPAGQVTIVLKADLR